jgi:hypothetical protein
MLCHLQGRRPCVSWLVVLGDTGLFCGHRALLRTGRPLVAQHLQLVAFLHEEVDVFIDAARHPSKLEAVRQFELVHVGIQAFDRVDGLG